MLLPAEPRHFAGQRWVNIGLRSAHLIGVAGIGGGFLFALEPSSWATYWYLTLTTGIALTLLYLWSTFHWLLELKGLAIVLKTLLMALALATPNLRGELFLTVIAISAVSAHAPAWMRGYPWLRLFGFGRLGRRDD
jgi:hypothetical protein